MRNELIKPCCEKLSIAIKDELIGCTECYPFSDEKIEPTVFIFSDGGHGGYYPISFCPFCGQQLLEPTQVSDIF